MSSSPCDIVILPENELATKAIEASTSLSTLDSIFILEDGKRFPHVSLFMLQIDENHLDTVQEALAVIAKSTQTLDLQASGYVQKEGFVDVGYEVTNSLSDLQQTVIKTVQPLADGMREKDKARMLEATGLALDNYQKYGFKYVGELFRPHITFTRFDSTESIPETERLLPDPTTFNGSFTKIGLFEMGDNGTCVRKIAAWRLGKVDETS